MNNEQQQVIDEAYENYERTVKDSITRATNEGILKGNLNDPFSYLGKESFVKRIKTDNEFSNRWGLQIEERELSLEERHQISISRIGHDGVADRNNITWHETYNKTGIPTKLITLTYNDKKIESYE